MKILPLGLLLTALLLPTAANHFAATPPVSSPMGTPSAPIRAMDSGSQFAGPFKWRSTGALISPTSNATHNLVSIKDPSVVYYGNRWHLFATTADTDKRWSMVYLNFTDWSDAHSAQPYYLDENPNLRGYHCAPQVFYFRPQNKWYLVFQSQQPTYSTTDDISKPETWSKPNDFFNGKPATVVDGWLDYWVICDDQNAYLFFTDDAGRFYRSQTEIGNFPNGFSNPVVVMRASNGFDLFEGGCTYRLKGTGKYLTLIEALGKTGNRYFRSFIADRLDGEWTPLAESWDNPFAGKQNVRFAYGIAPWTEDISHGEMIRDGYDETLTIDPANLQFLYQGFDPSKAGSDYALLPWKLGLLGLDGQVFVSPSGSDNNPGILAQPLASIQYAANQLNPGDTLFVRGGLYHEPVTINRSGSAEAPIHLEAYAGETPLFSGATPVTGPWIPYKDSIYKSTWPAQPLQVFANGCLLNEARWPNMPIEDPFNPAIGRTEAGTQYSITHSALPQVDLVGAWIHVMAGQSWVGYSRQVSAQDQATGKLSFLSPINALPELVPRRNNRFFVFGKLELLDAPGEWWWDPAEHLLYLWMPDGAAPDGRVEAGSADAVLSLSGQSYVTVKGIAARGGWFNLQNATSCVIEDFDLKAPNWVRAFNGYAITPQYLGGIEVSGNGNLVQRGLVRMAGRGGIHLAGSNNTVWQVSVEDCGLNWTNDSGIDLNSSEQALVENNRVRRTGAGGIYLAPDSRVINNVVSQPCRIMEDCGNIGSWFMDGKGAEVAGNVLHDNQSRWGAGIYLDAGSKNFYLHDNLIENILWNGINSTGVNIIENNTIRNFQHQGINFVPPSWDLGSNWSAGRVAHNLIAEPFPLTIYMQQPVSLTPEYASFEAHTTFAPGPRRIEIPWWDFAQGGWSHVEVPLNLSVVTDIVFSLEGPATSFIYTISNLRLLPIGKIGDEGAISIPTASWRLDCGNGAVCAITDRGPNTWGIAGSNPFFSTNRLVASLPASLQNLTSFRGIAFDLAGEATRGYDCQGYQGFDNGAEAISGRGATLPSTAREQLFRPSPPLRRR